MNLIQKSFNLKLKSIILIIESYPKIISSLKNIQNYIELYRTYFLCVFLFPLKVLRYEDEKLIDLKYFNFYFSKI